MKKQTKSIRNGPNGKYKKCRICSKVFSGQNYDKHRSLCGVNSKFTLKVAKKNKPVNPLNARKRSEVIAEMKKGQLNGPYTKIDEKELNRTQGSRYAGFVKK
jgi:hypothetical protein